MISKNEGTIQRWFKVIYLSPLTTVQNFSEINSHLKGRDLATLYCQRVLGNQDSNLEKVNQVALANSGIQ